MDPNQWNKPNDPFRPETGKQPPRAERPTAGPEKPMGEPKCWLAVAVLVLSGILMGILPILTPVWVVAGSVSMAYCVVRGSGLWISLGPVLVFAAGLLLSRNPAFSLLLVFLFVPLGTAVGLCLKQERSFKRTALVAACVVGVLLAVTLAALVYVQKGTLSVNAIRTAAGDLFDLYGREFSAAVEELAKLPEYEGVDVSVYYTMLSQMRSSFLSYFFGMFAFAAILLAFFAVWIARICTAPRSEARRAYIYDFKVTKLGAVLYVVSYLLNLLVSGPVGAVCGNLSVLLMPALYLEGLALIRWFSRTRFFWNEKLVMGLALVMTLTSMSSFPVLLISGFGLYDAMTAHRPARED